jgi:hypothetical protein
MDTIDALSVDAERNDNLKKARLENSLYNIIDGEKISTSRRLSVINPATGKQLAAVPYVHRALLNKAITDARNPSSGWGAFPFGRRKAILAGLLNKLDDHADELSALLTAEQGGPLAQARWEIDLLTKAFGPALMQMELHEKEQEVCVSELRSWCGVWLGRLRTLFQSSGRMPSAVWKNGYDATTNSLIVIGSSGTYLSLSRARVCFATSSRTTISLLFQRKSRHWITGSLARSLISSHVRRPCRPPSAK